MSPIENPWDHNAECRYCDEQAMHRADCPWLMRVEELLVDIRQQYERRQGMFASAGGDPETMQGSLTCYLEYTLLRKVFGKP